MISIKDKTHCCGCEACVNRCPKHCISMVEDNEGFLYPKVDTEKCIGCGECEKICPFLHQGQERNPKYTVATFNSNLPIRLSSSSGGVFSQLAEFVINQKGVVFGASFDSHWKVQHIFVENLEDLPKLRGSKYVQSRIGDSYKRVKTYLRENRQVLFSGTPCQIAGLKRFLGREYDNLMTVDVACHGIPSPKIWNLYLSELANRLLPDSVVTGVNFRDKFNGWKSYHMQVSMETLSEKKFYYVPFYDDWYMKAFLKNLILRPSCANCPARCGKSGSDLTIADFWGIESLCPDLDDDKGTSIVLINSPKGKELLGILHNRFEEIDYSAICRFNPCFVQSFTPHPFRQVFFKKVNASKSVADVMKLALSNSLYLRIKRKILLFIHN